MDLENYVADRIGEIFDDLAEVVSEMEVLEEAAAGFPMELFKAELFLKRAWAFYIGGELPEWGSGD